MSFKRELWNRNGSKYSLSCEMVSNSEAENVRLEDEDRRDLQLCLMMSSSWHHMKNCQWIFLRNMQLFIVIVNKMKRFLHLENGCHLNCWSHPQISTWHILFILVNSYRHFWINLRLVMKNGFLMKMFNVIDSGLLIGQIPKHKREWINDRRFTLNCYQQMKQSHLKSNVSI